MGREEHKNARIQEHRKTGTQEHRNTRIQNEDDGEGVIHGKRRHKNSE